MVWRISLIEWVWYLAAKTRESESGAWKWRCWWTLIWTDRICSTRMPNSIIRFVHWTCSVVTSPRSIWVNLWASRPLLREKMVSRDRKAVKMKGIRKTRQVGTQLSSIYLLSIFRIYFWLLFDWFKMIFFVTFRILLKMSTFKMISEHI